MGGWWPEHSTPDTGVRPARQFTLACTRSSAHSFGRFVVFTITLQTYFTELWLGWFCLFFFHLTCQYCECKTWVVYIGLLCWTYWGD